MESIEKLRSASLKFTPNIRREVNMALNEIEREIAERYMLLPVDAVGVPIRPGDQMADGSQRVDGLGLAKWDVVSVNKCVFFDMSGGLHIGNQCYHVKPDPVKELLRSFYVLAVRGKTVDVNDIDNAVLEDHAERIRKAVES